MSKKITRDMVPKGFTTGLALFDMLPVVLFGINCVLIGHNAGSMLFTAGAVVCLLSGAIKVLWKLVVALRKKNIWPMFIQMRIAMPAGFALMALAFPVDRIQVDIESIFAMPSGAFYIAGIAGMVLMGVFAVKLDSSDVRSNYVEQLTNSLSQALILAGLLIK